jgi:hypothetical protein
LCSSVKPAVRNYHERSSLSTKYGYSIYVYIYVWYDVNIINTYFADIASKPHYDSKVIEQLVRSLAQQFNSCFVLFCLLTLKFTKCYLKLRRLLQDLISIGYSMDVLDSFLQLFYIFWTSFHPFVQYLSSVMKACYCNSHLRLISQMLFKCLLRLLYLCMTIITFRPSLLKTLF